MRLHDKATGGAAGGRLGSTNKNRNNPNAKQENNNIPLENLIKEQRNIERNATIARNRHGGMILYRSKNTMTNPELGISFYGISLRGIRSYITENTSGTRYWKFHITNDELNYIVNLDLPTNKL